MKITRNIGVGLLSSGVVVALIVVGLLFPSLFFPSPVSQSIDARRVESASAQLPTGLIAPIMFVFETPSCEISSDPFNNEFGITLIEFNNSLGYTYSAGKGNSIESILQEPVRIMIEQNSCSLFFVNKIGDSRGLDLTIKWYRQEGREPAQYYTIALQQARIISAEHTSNQDIGHVVELLLLYERLIITSINQNGSEDQFVWDGNQNPP